MLLRSQQGLLTHSTSREVNRVCGARSCSRSFSMNDLGLDALTTLGKVILGAVLTCAVIGLVAVVAVLVHVL